MRSPTSAHGFRGINQDCRDATNHTNATTNVSPADASVYLVSVSNPYGSVLSSNALLTIDGQ
jgi:hypothetical protein